MLAGHLHRGYTGDIRTHHVDIRRGILVAQAGTAVSHRVRNEANGYNVIRLSPLRLGFAVRAWDGRGFHEARFVEYVEERLRLAARREWLRVAQLLQPPPACAPFASRPSVVVGLAILVLVLAQLRLMRLGRPPACPLGRRCCRGRTRSS